MSRPMPKLVRMYIRHTLIGFAIAAVFVAGLFWANVGNLWHLVSTSDVGVLATVLLVVFNGVVFSGVQFGIAIMRMGEDEGTGSGRRPARAYRPERLTESVPVRPDRAG